MSWPAEQRAAVTREVEHLVGFVRQSVAGLSTEFQEKAEEIRQTALLQVEALEAGTISPGQAEENLGKVSHALRNELLRAGRAAASKQVEVAQAAIASVLKLAFWLLA